MKLLAQAIALAAVSQVASASVSTAGGPDPLLYSHAASSTDQLGLAGRIAWNCAVYSVSNAGTVSVYAERFGGSVGAITVDYTVTGTCRMTSGTPGAYEGKFTAASGSLTWAAGEYARKKINVVIESVPDGYAQLTVAMTAQSSADTVRTPYCYIKIENGQQIPNAYIDSNGYEVDTDSGSDAAAGTTSAPLKTITKATELSSANSTKRLIRVKTPAVSINERIKSSGTIGGGINIYNRVASASAPMIITSYHGQRPLIDQAYGSSSVNGDGVTGVTPRCAGFYISGSTHIYINRFEVTRAQCAVYMESDAAGGSFHPLIHDVRGVEGGTADVTSNVATYRIDSSRYAVLSQCYGTRWYTGQAQGIDMYTNSGLHLAVGVTGFQVTKSWMDACHFHRLHRGIYLKQHAGPNLASGPDENDFGYYVSRCYTHDNRYANEISAQGSGAVSPKECHFVYNIFRNNGSIFGIEINAQTGEDQGHGLLLQNNIQIRKVIRASSLGETATTISGNTTINSGNIASYKFHEGEAAVPSGQTWTVTLPLRADITFNARGEAWFTFVNTGAGTLTIAAATGQAISANDGTATASINLATNGVTTLCIHTDSYRGTGDDWWVQPRSSITGIGTRNQSNAVFVGNSWDGNDNNMFAIQEPASGLLNDVLLSNYNNYQNRAGNWVFRKDSASEVAYSNLTNLRAATVHEDNATETAPIYQDGANADWRITNVATGWAGRRPGIDGIWSVR